jgi:hypothetical protein
MTKIIIAALACIALAPAQETKAPTSAVAARPLAGCCIQMVYRVKNVDTRALYRLVSVNLNAAAGQVTPSLNYDDSLRAISVYGTKEEVASIMRNLSELDVAAGPGLRDEKVSITFWLVAASVASDAAAPAPPAEIEPALKTVASTFGYKTFRLLDSAIVLSKAGGNFQTRGNAIAPSPKLQSRQMASYRAGARSVKIESSGTTRVVRLDQFSLHIQVPYCSDSSDPTCKQFQFGNLEMSNSFDVREGQKVIVGKSKLDGADSDLILVVSAKVVD